MTGTKREMPSEEEFKAFAEKHEGKSFEEIIHLLSIELLKNPDSKEALRQAMKAHGCNVDELKPFKIEKV